MELSLHPVQVTRVWPKRFVGSKCFVKLGPMLHITTVDPQHIQQRLWMTALAAGEKAALDAEIHTETGCLLLLCGPTFEAISHYL